MGAMEQDLAERIDQEEKALELDRYGDVAITVGEALLGMDLILVCFVDIGFRTGSYLFSWWVLAEGLMGVILLGAGARQKSRAQARLNALEPKLPLD